jgi:hypothetical protein
VSFPGRKTLTCGDRIVVRAIAEAMFSQDGEVSDARLDAHVMDVDRYVSVASRAIRSGLRVALFVVRIAPILMFFRLRTLERLSVDDRVALLSRLERSRLALLSLAFIGWRSVMTLVFYEDPIELRNMGYAGEERFRHKRRLPALPVLASAPSLVPLEALVARVPVPEESGVRLRSDRDVDSERPAAAAPRGDSREVA